MLVMESRSDRPHELERQLERRMRAQERQLAWVRLGMVALAAAVLLIVAPTMPGIEILLAVLGVVAAWSVLVFWLLRRFPAREVGIISTVVEMAAVTIAVYVAVDAPDGLAGSRVLGRPTGVAEQQLVGGEETRGSCALHQCHRKVTADAVAC